MSDRIDLDEVRARVEERLDRKAAAHCNAVAETAAELASTYGVDTGRAFLGGLLHDWAREETPGELLASAARMGLEITDVDAAVPYLLHARVGAQQVKAAFPGVDADVLEAVATHTMGDVEMSDLARIVYIADLIEPARHFEGVGELRQAVGVVSLEELFIRSCTASLTHLLRLRRRIHPHTVAVWNAIVDAGGE